jgi:hypothetical protein
VIVYKNGSGPHGGEKLFRTLLPPTIELLLDLSTKKLGLCVRSP